MASEIDLRHLKSVLGASWERLGSVLERFGSVLGASWEHPGTILEHFEASWERFGESDGPFGEVLEGFLFSKLSFVWTLRCEANFISIFHRLLECRSLKIL